MKISFGSTYRIEITQPGVNKSKKARLRDLIKSNGGLIGSSNTGAARISISNEDDDMFEKSLKSIGYKQYQKFEAENLDKNETDAYIKSKLDSRDYIQVGKQKNTNRKIYIDENE